MKDVGLNYQNSKESCYLLKTEPPFQLKNIPIGNHLMVKNPDINFSRRLFISWLEQV
jgi:hypothetical protein